MTKEIFAKELFANLGFVMTHDTQWMKIYYNDVEDQMINFQVDHFYFRGEINLITFPLFLAIQKQIKELGWTMEQFNQRY